MSRFAIKRDPIYRPLLALFTATAGRSWVEVRPEALVTQYGWHRMEIPRRTIASAERAQWRWWQGIGWRTNFRSVLGLIGATTPVVRVHLAESHRTRLLGLPVRVTDLYISLEEPERFIAEVSG